jgi:uncharacterized protein (DUF952 family)
VIDADELGVPVVTENVDDGDGDFPHIYGALPVHAITEVRSASITPDGRFIIGGALGERNS